MSAEIILPEPYLALDRLNSWLRSRQPLWCPMRSKLSHAIYWTKNAAILGASKQWPVAMRRVKVESRCRSCGGSGTWRSWHAGLDEDDDGERCRTCQATGQVTLKFVETTIGSIRWHTPEPRFRSASLDVYVPFSLDGDYEEATDWKPNQPGKPMPLADVERDMLTVLREWPHEVCAGLEKQFRCPDVRKAEEWLRLNFSMWGPIQAA